MTRKLAYVFLTMAIGVATLSGCGTVANHSTQAEHSMADGTASVKESAPVVQSQTETAAATETPTPIPTPTPVPSYEKLAMEFLDAVAAGDSERVREAMWVRDYPTVTTDDVEWWLQGSSYAEAFGCGEKGELLKTRSCGTTAHEAYEIQFRLGSVQGKFRVNSGPWVVDPMDKTIGFRWQCRVPQGCGFAFNGLEIEEGDKVQSSKWWDTYEIVVPTRLAKLTVTSSVYGAIDVNATPNPSDTDSFMVKARLDEEAEYEMLKAMQDICDQYFAAVSPRDGHADPAVVRKLVSEAPGTDIALYDKLCGYDATDTHNGRTVYVNCHIKSITGAVYIGTDDSLRLEYKAVKQFRFSQFTDTTYTSLDTAYIAFEDDVWRLRRLVDIDENILSDYF